MSDDTSKGDLEYRELIIRELVCAKEDVMKDLVARSKRYLNLLEDGSIYLTNETRDFSQGDRILLYLIGKWFACQAGLSERDDAAYAEISDQLSMPMGTVKGTTHRLINDCLLQKTDKGAFRVVYGRIDDIINEIEGKVKK